MRGFTECAMEYVDYGYGTFKKHLAGYEITLKPIKQEAGDYCISVNFAIKDDQRDGLFAYAYLRSTATLNELRGKLEALCEEISDTVTTFNRDV